MIAFIIDWSIRHRILVLIVSILLGFAGFYSAKQTPIDAIPDLSDVQVIIKTNYPGQAPQVVEDQVTYPISTAMLAVPGAQTVRGYSFYGDSYVYVIFDDQTDLYWARSRVLEYLSQVTARLPTNVNPELGPDATGVGWIYSYILQDKTGQHDLAELRSIQDWFLKYELQTIPGVSEVATVGGMVKQYQIQIDPNQLRAHQIPLEKINQAIRRGNQEIGASVIEQGEAEHMIRATGYLESIEDIRNLPIQMTPNGTPLLMKDIAEIQIGPQMRRGISEFNGEGETVGGIIVMRSGDNAAQVIAAVKEKIAEVKRSLPSGVEIVPTYDRAKLIDAAVENLWHKLAEEFVVVGLVCALFLFHLRSSLVVMISLPIGILSAFILMNWQGINANIMSLGGIAIAIGAMVDGAIVMVENVHKHIERTPLTDQNRWQIIGNSAKEVGAPLFFSLLIITLSFLPVFALQGQEGKMFAPLAYTKTYAMAVSAGLAITLVPVLMGYLIRGKVLPENKNPMNRLVVTLYRPLLGFTLKYPKTILALSALLLASAYYPASRIGSEFIPPLDEGDLMYMPTTYPGISIGKARELLQQTNKLIKTLPEVESVWGKVGRAETATDPAPITMVETMIQLKPKSEWRDGMTGEKLRQALDALIQFPGLTNAWVMPIKTRIDMLATGIKTPVGIKISGPDLDEIELIGSQLENLLSPIEGTVSVYSERVVGGRYLTIDILRQAAARFGLNIADIQGVVASAIGGVTVGETVEGLERYPIQVRYPQDQRNSLTQLENLPIVTPSGLNLRLGDVAEIRYEDGPPMIKTENARPQGLVYVDIEGRDLGSYVAEAQTIVAEKLKLPAGYAVTWSGQYEYLERAKARLSLVVPIMILIIMGLLYLSFQRFSEVMIIMLSLPLACVGGLWLMYFLEFNFSVAVGVGFISLAGVAVEIGVIMLVYLNQSWQAKKQGGVDNETPLKHTDLIQAIHQGAGLRIRPIMMTVLTVVIGLFPILLNEGTGSEVMQRIATPMIGGMASALILNLFVLPAMFFIWKRPSLEN